MSMESAKAYVQRLKTDKDFAKKIGGFEDKASRAAFVTKEGYSFTKEEMANAGSELSDNELDAVAGGCGVDFCECGTDWPWS